MTRVDDLLADARRIGVDRLDAQLLLAHHLGVTRTWLIAHGDHQLPAATLAGARAALDRRADGVPLAYLTGRREFHGLTLDVTPDVLDPRPDTETLVDWALQLMPPAARVLDLGTGSGAIAVALKHARPAAQVTATDSSDAALAVARANARRHGLAIEFRLGDWWQALAAGEQFDLVVSNPPYIAGDDPHLPALRHEPLSALTPGGDGLDALRRIAGGAPPHLAPGAWLLLEHGFDQAEAVRALLSAQRLETVGTRCDLAGRPRCTSGRRPMDTHTHHGMP